MPNHAVRRPPTKPRRRVWPIACGAGLLTFGSVVGIAAGQEPAPYQPGTTAAAPSTGRAQVTASVPIVVTPAPVFDPTVEHIDPSEQPGGYGVPAEATGSVASGPVGTRTPAGTSEAPDGAAGPVSGAPVSTTPPAAATTPPPDCASVFVECIEPDHEVHLTPTPTPTTTAPTTEPAPTTAPETTEPTETSAPETSAEPTPLIPIIEEVLG